MSARWRQSREQFQDSAGEPALTGNPAPTPILGPTGDLVQADVGAALARVAGGTATPAVACRVVLKQAATAARGS